MIWGFYCENRMDHITKDKATGPRERAFARGLCFVPYFCTNHHYANRTGITQSFKVGRAAVWPMDSFFSHVWPDHQKSLYGC